MGTNNIEVQKRVIKLHPFKEEAGLPIADESIELLPEIQAQAVDSEAASLGHVLTADGNGGAEWNVPPVTDVTINNNTIVENTVAKILSDSAPVENSTNLVESGGTYTAIKEEETRAKQAETDINIRIDNLDLAQVGTSDGFIKYVSQADGQVSATAELFDKDFTNPTNNTAPTSKAVDTLIKALDVAQVGDSNTNSYIKYISESDGKISAGVGNFAISIPATNNNPSEINAPTVKAVRDAINDLDVQAIIVGANQTITSISETDGLISASASNISIASEQVNDKVTTITQESDDIPTTTAVKAYADAVDNSAVHKAGEEVITGTKQFNNGLKVGNVNGGWKEYQNGSGFLKIAQDSTDILQVGNYLIWPETANSIDLGGEQHTFKDLYVAGNLKDGSATRAISGIQPTYTYSADNSLGLFDTTPTQNSTNPVTSGGIKTYVDNSIADLDVASITGFGAGKTLATLTETDGKISATFQDVSIASSQVNDKITVISEDSNNVPTTTAVKNFVNSSIATNTANFIGTFDSLADLKADQQPKTNNDYAFVKNSTVYYDITTTPPMDFPTKVALDAYSKTNLTNYDYAWVINAEDSTKFDLYRYDIVQESWDLRLSKITKSQATLNIAYNRYKYTANNAS